MSSAEEEGLLSPSGEISEAAARRRRDYVSSSLNWKPGLTFLGKGIILVASMSLLLLVSSHSTSLTRKNTIERPHMVQINPSSDIGDETDEWEPASFTPPDDPDTEPDKPPANDGIPYVNNPDDMNSDTTRPNSDAEADSLFTEYSFSYTSTTTYSPTYTPTTYAPTTADQAVGINILFSYSFSFDDYTPTYYPTISTYLPSYVPSPSPTILISERTHPPTK